MTRTLFITLAAVTVAFSAATLLVMAAGEPASALWQAVGISLSSEGLGYTLFYATPLILTGLSVATSFHCGLFNIGGEGQLYIGSLLVIVVATYFPNLPAPIALTLAILGAAAGGFFWGALAGIFKALRGSHEVIVTILLNFIAYAIVDYSILYQFKDPSSQSPETIGVAHAYFLPTLDQIARPFGVLYFQSTPANVSLFLAMASAIGIWVLLQKTRTGFEFRVVGANCMAAKFAGINISRATVMSLGISGGLAGLVGINEILGHEHRLIQGFSPQYGFTGIAVSLLARNHPIGVVFSGLLFGLLHNMSREIEFSTNHVSKELALVMQAILIAAVAAIPGLIGRPRLSNPEKPQ